MVSSPFTYLYTYTVSYIYILYCFLVLSNLKCVFKFWNENSEKPKNHNDHPLLWISPQKHLIEITEEPQKIVSLNAHNFETSLKATSWPMAFSGRKTLRENCMLHKCFNPRYFSQDLFLSYLGCNSPSLFLMPFLSCTAPKLRFIDHPWMIKVQKISSLHSDTLLFYFR